MSVNRQLSTVNSFISGIYVITAESKHLGRSHADVCLSALKGGARLIQYREKNKDTSEMIKEAIELKKLCKKYDALFIVNDRLEVALESEADGLHLGQNDGDYNEARKALPGKVIGLSATNFQEAIAVSEAGCDYIGAGPVFDTPSKDDASAPFGLEELSKISEAINVPLIAIGGINKENAASVINAGADALAVISAVASADYMVEATRDLLRQAKLAEENKEMGTLYHGDTLAL